MIVLIPSYRPDERLVALVQDLRTAAPDAEVLVVDDGSGPAYDAVFAEAAHGGAQVERFPRNRGKGAALRSGFAWVAEHRPGHDVVCADSDGQHTPDDIVAVAAAVRPGAMVLGGRRFTGEVPWRSRVGNTLIRWAFRLGTGQRVHDTQTGLRGYPAELLDWLQTIPGDRFEYEFNLLLEAPDAGVAIDEVEIATIYLDDNASSHFRPVADSVRIYAPLLLRPLRRLLPRGVSG